MHKKPLLQLHKLIIKSSYCVLQSSLLLFAALLQSPTPLKSEALAVLRRCWQKMGHVKQDNFVVISIILAMNFIVTPRVLKILWNGFLNNVDF